MMAAVRRWLNSLFARIFLVQMLIMLALGASFYFFTYNEQADVFVRTSTPIWAAALKAASPALKDTPSLQQGIDVRTRVRLLAGPPPADSHSAALLLRYRLLRQALRAQGVPVDAIRISEATAATPVITWLQLQKRGGMEWVGIQAGAGVEDVRLHRLLSLLLAVLFFIAGCWGLTRWITRPVKQLDANIKRFADHGERSAASQTGPEELRQLEHSFESMVTLLQQQDEQRYLMLGAISHDLRSPLGRIRMALSLLPDDDASRDKRALIDRNIQLADRLLQNFLDLARSHSLKQADTVDLAALIHSLADSYDGTAVACHLPDSGAVLENADQQGLERALINLLDNALLYGRPPVDVSLDIEADALRLVVRDHGDGIPSGQVGAMLQPFQRGDLSRGRPGTGLGLTIVHETVLRHDGELTFDDARPGLAAVIRLPFRRVARSD
jgi:two-component system osmolarity sensor histidine kinase EnvZ